MTGTFSSLQTALGALRYSRVAMDVASGNIANVSTDGYTRRRAEAASVGAPVQVAMWSRYDGAGDGVQVAGITRLSDDLLSVRARREHSNQSYLDVRQASLERIENGIGEPGDTAVSGALATFRSSWSDLVNNPNASASRQQVLSSASGVVDALRIQATNVTNEAGDQRARLVADVAQVNTVSANLASANKAIAAGMLDGSDVGTLLDQRDQLTMQLSQLTGGTATIRPDGGADVAVNGVSLVAGDKAGTLAITTGVTATGAADGQPVTFSITDSSGTTTAVPTGLTGEIGGVTDLLDTTYPAYLTGLGAVAAQLADGINALHQAGYDATGTAGGQFFSYDPADPVGTLAVAITDPQKVAASGIPGGGLDTSNANKIATATGVEDAYQRLVTGFGTEVVSVRNLAATQQVVTGQVDDAREQLSGVNTDEETVSLMASQRAYEAAARVMTTMDSILDTLINRTGVTH
jgi:flagellar hook-associated protein 1 FlgK